MRYAARIMLLAPLALLASAACARFGNPPVTRSFPARDVTRVVVRAARADSIIVVTDSLAGLITISGKPRGGAGGYHGGWLWRETPANKWGLDFVTAQRGSVLVISTRNEISYIHHHYSLDGLIIRVPPNVEVVRQRRTLSGDGGPDLSPP